MIHIVSIISSAIFMAVGGDNFLLARRELMPLIICSDAYYTTKSPWCFLMLSACFILHLGYGDKSKFRHIFSDTWGRGVWSFLVALCLSAPMFFTGHISLPYFIGYLVLGFFIEPLFKNLWQVAGDLIIGAGLASVVFIIK